MEFTQIKNIGNLDNIYNVLDSPHPLISKSQEIYPSPPPQDDDIYNEPQEINDFI